MNELLYSCSSTLDQAETPACGTDFGERVRTIVISKTNLWDSAPTAEEINVAWEAGDVTVFSGIVNGHRIFVGSQEIEVIYKEQVDKMYRIEGKIIRFNEDTSRMAEKLNRYPNLYIWYITDKNYCFGGYDCSINFTLRLMEGKGVRPYIAFSFDFIDIGIDYSRYDTYFTYTPEVGPTVVTSDSTIITVDSTFITSDMT